MKNIADKAMGLNGDGLAFYDFADIPDAKEFKTKYRTALDNLPMSESDGDLIISEANYAFKLNMDVFDEIGSSRPFPIIATIQGLLQLAWGAIKSKK